MTKFWQEPRDFSSPEGDRLLKSCGAHKLESHALGAAVTYRVLHLTGTLEVVRVGPDIDAGDVVQLVVPRGAYKAAELTDGEFGLVGEAVGPGFDFRDFSWVREEQVMGSPHFDELRRFIKPDQRRDFEKFYDRADGARHPSAFAVGSRGCLRVPISLPSRGTSWSRPRCN